MIKVCRRKACKSDESITSFPDDDWLYVFKGSLDSEELAFCSWQCLSMYAAEKRPVFI